MVLNATNYAEALVDLVWDVCNSVLPFGRSAIVSELAAIPDFRKFFSRTWAPAGSIRL